MVTRREHLKDSLIIAGLAAVGTSVVLSPRYRTARFWHTMGRWIAEEFGPNTPLHFSRFFPLYKLSHFYPTPRKDLLAARTIALEEKLKFVYIGNVPDLDTNTYCLNCGELLVSRSGYIVENRNLESGHCRKCSAMIPGIWA